MMCVGMVFSLDMTGQFDQRTEFQSILDAFAGRVLELPSGTIYIDASTGTGGPHFAALIVKPGTTIRGNGTTIAFRNVADSSRNLLCLSDDVTLEDLRITFRLPDNPKLNFNIATSGYLVFGQGIRRIRMNRVAMESGGELQYVFWTTQGVAGFFDCHDCVLDDITVKWSIGTSFGMEFLGGSNNVVLNSRFLGNAADGVKIHGNGFYGRAERNRFVNCQMNGNGAAIMQGQDTTTPGLNVVVPQQPIGFENRTRYTLNYTTTGTTVTFPAATGNDSWFLYSKRIGSQEVTLNTAAGDLFFGVLGGNGGVTTALLSNAFDRVSLRFKRTERPGKVGWEIDAYTNGQGVDLAGIGIAFTGCSAVGNQAGGFQIKPANTALAWNETIGYPQYSLVSFPQPGPTQTYRNKVSIAEPVPPSVLPPPPNDSRWEVFQPNAVSDISFVGCRVEDDWSGNGFAVVNAIAEGLGGGTPVPPPENISYLGCSAVRNFSSGFAFTTNTIIGVLMANCVSRSNLNSGVSVQQFCRNVKLVNCQLHGNGTIATAGTSWNLVIHAASGVRVMNCCLQGTDAVDQNLTTVSQIDDSVYARCGGVFITLKQSAFQLTDAAFSGLRVRNHAGGINVDYRGSIPDNRGSFIDVANLCTMNYGVDGFVASLKAGGTLPANSRVKLDNLGQVVLATSVDRAIGEVLGGNGGSFVDVRIAGVRQGEAATMLTGGSLKSGELVYPAANGTWSNSGSVAVGQVLLNAGAEVLPGGLFSYLTYI